MPAAIIIAEKPKGGKMGPPPQPKAAPKAGPRMAPPPDPREAKPKEDAGEKASSKDAMVISGDLAQALGGLSDDCVCGNCSMFDGSGGCSKVDGQFEPDDRCLRYFESGGNGETEPDADDQQGPDGDDGQ